jgi:protein phosphatase
MSNNLIRLPEFSLVLLVGASGSGKTTFARRHFISTEILSSDRFRAMIADDENCMEVSGDAFEVLYMVTRKRLARKMLTIIDATNIQDYGRRILLDIAAEYRAPVVAVILNIPEKVCIERTMKRTDRPIPLDVVLNHCKELKETLQVIHNEGFYAVYTLNGEGSVNQAIVAISEISDEEISRSEYESSFSVEISLPQISSVPIS